MKPSVTRFLPVAKHRKGKSLLSNPLLQKVLCLVFARVYRRWLWNDFFSTYDRVLEVYGWRTARVVSIGFSGKQVSTRWMQPCFWIFQ